MQFFQRFSIKEVVKNKKKRVVIKKKTLKTFPHPVAPGAKCAIPDCLIVMT